MILLDSSGWLELFTNGPLADRFEHHLQRSRTWVMSSINLFEVYKKIARHSEDDALRAIAVMRQGTLIPVDERVSLEAADLALQHGLAMADSLILATAQIANATLVTKDRDFQKLPGCLVITE